MGLPLPAINLPVRKVGADGANQLRGLLENGTPLGPAERVGHIVEQQSVVVLANPNDSGGAIRKNAET